MVAALESVRAANVAAAETLPADMLLEAVNLAYHVHQAKALALGIVARMEEAEKGKAENG